MSTEKSKQITGKQLSESAYLNEKDLAIDYAKVMPLIAYDTNHVKEKVSELEEEVKEKDARIRELEAQLKTQTPVLEVLAKQAVMNRGKGVNETEDDAVLRRFFAETEKKKREKVQID